MSKAGARTESEARALARLVEIAKEEGWDQVTQRRVVAAADEVRKLHLLDPKPRARKEQERSYSRMWRAVQVLGVEFAALPHVEQQLLAHAFTARGLPNGTFDSLQAAIESVLPAATGKAETKPKITERTTMYVALVATALRHLPSVKPDHSSVLFVEVCEKVFAAAGIERGAQNAIKRFNDSGIRAQLNSEGVCS